MATEEHKPECKDLMMPKLGTCCPSCGHRQGHLHVGWKEIGKILITRVNCEKCGHNSIIIRYADDANVKDLCDFLEGWKAK